MKSLFGKYLMSYVNDFNKLNTKEEKKLFLNSFNEERRATNAQIMYKEIYNETKLKEGNLNPGESHREYSQRFSPLKEISQRFSEEDSSLIISTLKYQQSQIQDEIMASPPKLYHFSNVSPEKFEGDILRKKELLTMYEEDLVNASFASPNELSMYPLQVEGISNYFCGFSPNPEDKFAILSSKEKFLQYKKENPVSYGYEVNKNDFIPTVSLSGDFSNEFYSEKDAKISKDNPIELTVEKMMRKGIQIFFVDNNEDVTKLVNILGEIQGGRNKFDKLLEMSKSGKVDYYNQDIGISNEFESNRYRINNLRKRLNEGNLEKPPYKSTQDVSKVDFNTLKVYRDKKQNS